VLLKSVVDRTETCGLDFACGDISAHPGEDLLPFAIERTTELLDLVERSGQR
jgi:hypothetical protein